jgi:hypothetical protein
VPGWARRLLPEHLPDDGDAAEHPGGVEGEEDLGRLAIGHPLQRLQVSDGDQIRGRVAVVDSAVDALDGLTLTFGHGEQLVLLGVGHPLDRLRLTGSFEDLALLDSLGAEDGGGFAPLGLGHLGPPVTLRLHLAMHGVGDVCRRLDPLQLHADDADTPFVGGVVEDLPQLGIDHLT